jgi:hypothetical protein
MLATCAINTIDVTPIGAVYTAVLVTVVSIAVFVLNVFNGINAIYYPLLIYAFNG